jgi:hypothetical protein
MLCLPLAAPARRRYETPLFLLATSETMPDKCALLMASHGCVWVLLVVGSCLTVTTCHVHMQGFGDTTSEPGGEEGTEDMEEQRQQGPARKKSRVSMATSEGVSGVITQPRDACVTSVYESYVQRWKPSNHQ